jgi:hypothetical protein
MSKHELFVIDRKPELNNEEQARVEYLREKLSAAESLGLKAQARNIEADVATVERGRLITTAPMSETELTIWRAWLPTTYDTLKTYAFGHHKLADYNYDHIPSPVLKMWKQHKESGAFERFEIWSPEKWPDPILIGVNGNAKHLLARWGESDANLVSFDDIKRELVRRWHKGEYFRGERWSKQHCAEVAVIPAAVVAVLSIVFIESVPTSFIIPAAALLVSAGVFICVRHWMIKRLWKSSPLMQAIAKDNSQPRELLPTSA